MRQTDTGSDKPASAGKFPGQILKFCIFFGIGIFIIWIFQRNLSEAEKQEIGNSLRNARWNMVFLIALFGLLSNVFRTLRWNLLFQPLGYKPRFHNTFFSILVAYFANLAIPRLGEVLRCTFMYRYEKIPVQKSLGTVLSERVIDILTFLLIFIIAFAVEYRALSSYVGRLFDRGMDGKGSGLPAAIAILSLVVVAIVVAVWYYRKNKQKFAPDSRVKKIADVFKGFGEGFLSLRHLRSPWLFLLWTLGLWLCYWLMMYCAFHSLSALSDTSFGIALIALAMGTVGVMLTPGGIGVYPVIISETLAVFGIAKTVGYTAGWISWGTQTALIIMAGLLALCLFPLLNRKKIGS